MDWKSFAIGAAVFGGIGVAVIYALLRWLIDNTTGWR